jgi:hypothetical protein
VLFCHRNPIDRQAGFRPVGADAGLAGLDGDPAIRQTSGTEDLLLFSDIVETLALALGREGAPVSSPEGLAKGLLAVRLHKGRLGMGPEGTALFRADGQRNPGTGEHVVHLIPELEGERVLPRATIEVWRRAGAQVWRRQGPPLVVGYDDAMKVAQEPGKGGH